MTLNKKKMLEEKLASIPEISFPKSLLTEEVWENYYTLFKVIDSRINKTLLVIRLLNPQNKQLDIKNNLKNEIEEMYNDRNEYFKHNITIVKLGGGAINKNSTSIELIHKGRDFWNESDRTKALYILKAFFKDKNLVLQEN